MVATVALNKEDREFLEEINKLCLSNKDAMNIILAHFGANGDFGKALAAIEQLEKNQAEMARNFGAQISLIRGATYDSRRNYRGIYGDEAEARAAGLYFLGALGGRAKAMEAYQKDFKDSYERSQGTVDDAAGGVLIDPMFSSRIIRLVEEYGVFAAKALTMPMTGPTLSYRKQVGEPTMYLVGEGDPPTDTQLSWVRINLVARKWGCLNFYPEELGEDAAVPIAEMIGRSIAWANAYHTDRVGFNGTGSLADLRVTGVITKLRNLGDGTIANISGIKVGTGNAFSELTRGDHTDTEGLLPQYAAKNAEWYCSRPYFFGVMVPLMLSAGGVTAGEVQNKRQLLFNGNAVNIVQVMPKKEANSQVSALFGDLSQAVDFGKRKELTVKRSTEYKFAEGMVTVIGVCRQDIQVHSVGNATATEADKVPGPIVGLATAAA